MLYHCKVFFALLIAPRESEKQLDPLVACISPSEDSQLRIFDLLVSKSIETKFALLWSFFIKMKIYPSS